MAYSGPTYQSNQQDRRGDFYYQGAQAFGQGVGNGIKSFGDRLKEIADNKETSAALDAGLETMRSTRPDLVPVIDEVQDKFYGSNVKGKQSIFSQLMAAGMRTDQLDQQATKDKMAQSDYYLKTIQAANAAAYQNAGIENMQADNERQNKRLDYDLMPDNQTPIATPTGDATAYGVTGEKSGTRYQQFYPNKPAAPKLRAQTDPATGVTVYELDGKPVNPDDILLAEPGPVENTLFEGIGPPPPVDSGLLPPPAAPARPSLVPLRKSAAEAAPKIFYVPDPANPEIRRPMIWNKDHTSLVPAPVEPPAIKQLNSSPTIKQLNSSPTSKLDEALSVFGK